MDKTDFGRLAEKRMPKTQKAIQLIGNLSTYKHETREAEALIATLEKELAKVRERFKLTQPAEPPARVPATVDEHGCGQQASEKKNLPAEAGGPVADRVASDIKWAIDAMAYDKQMARDLLTRALANAYEAAK